MKEVDLTLDHLKSLLVYDPGTGLFRWKFIAGMGGKIPAKSIAGSKGKYGGGYIEITILGRLFKAHRLAWLYMTDKWPKNEIDHINRERADNRFCNLRESTLQQNLKNKNKYKSNTSGYVGVHWRECMGKWQARIGVNTKRISLGHFNTPEEAHMAYIEAKEKYHVFN